MSKQTINIGSAANDGTGDPLRTAFQKCNGNFDELYVGSDLSGYAPLASPTFTGDPKAPTPATADNDTSIATTAFVQTNLAIYAPLASPALTGNPTAPTPTAGDNDTSIATTAFVNTRAGNYLPLAGGTLTGTLTISSAGTLVVQSTAVSSSPITGALTVAGDIGARGMTLGASGLTVANAVNERFLVTSHAAISSGNRIGSLNDAGNAWQPLEITSRTYIADFTASTSPTTGALTVAGGLGVSGIVCAGDRFQVGTTNQPGFGNIAVGFSVDTASFACHSAAGTSAAFNTNTDGVNVYYMRSGAAVGSVSCTTTATAYNTSSDARLKTDLQPFDDAGAILDTIKVYDFAWIANGERAHGVVAQEAEQVYPEAVMHDESSDLWGVDYSKFVPLLLQEIKSLRARVAALESAT